MPNIKFIIINQLQKHALKIVNNSDTLISNIQAISVWHIAFLGTGIATAFAFQNREEGLKNMPHRTLG